jgi:membrane protein required for colicin V production
MANNLLDLLLLAVMLISGFIGAARGLLRVAIGAACCVAATLVTMLWTLVYPLTQTDFGSEIFFGYIPGAVFLAALIAFLILAARTTRIVLNSRISTVDRTLGFAFGLFRGFLIVVVAFQFLIWLVPDSSQPEWVRSAKSRVVLIDTGNRLVSMLPEKDEADLTAPLRSVVGLIVDAVILSFAIDFLAAPRWNRLLASRHDRSPREITTNTLEPGRNLLFRTASFRDSRPVRWFYAINGSHAGPIAEDDVRELLRRGSINQDTLVWNETFGQSWKRLCDTEISGGILQPPPLPRAFDGDGTG